MIKHIAKIVPSHVMAKHAKEQYIILQDDIANYLSTNILNRKKFLSTLPRNINQKFTIFVT